MAARVERLVNLCAALSHTRRPLTLAEIRDRVPGYAEGEAGRRAFERDKEELRDLGVEIDVSVDGYLVRPDAWTMKPFHLEPDEASALVLAAQVARLEGEGPEPALRVAAMLAGPAPATTGPPLSARLGATGAQRDVIADAVDRSRPLTFLYRTARGAGGPEQRHLDPYGIVLARGRWYVAGRDRDREAIRSFRLDRIEGQVVAGAAGGFRRPDGFDLRAAVPPDPWAMAESPVPVRLLLDADVAWWARPAIPGGRVAEERDAGSVVVEVAVAFEEPFIALVASLLDSAEILSPPEMRDRLLAHVRAVAEQR